MSTEVEQQPTPAVTEENGATTAPAETAQNGEEAKRNGVTKKEVAPPKDPKTETAEWLKQQNKKAIQKANFYILQWIINEVYGEEEQKPELPKTGFVTKQEFLGFLQDGTLLARLANKLKPGAVETVKEGEDAKTKENQKANVDGFTAFAKEHVPEETVFSFEDLEKGKESFLKVFVTLFQLALKASEFQRPGIDFDQLFKELSEIVPKKFWQKLLDNLNNAGTYVNTFVRRTFNRTINAQAEQNGTATTNGVHANGTENDIHEEPNGVPNGTKVEEKKEEAPAVAAN